MKNNIQSKLAAALLCLVMIFFASCTAKNTDSPPTPDTDVSSTPQNGAKKIVSQVRKVYSTADEFEEMTFAHYEESPDILLIDTETACNFVFKSLLSDYGEYTIEQTDTTLTIKRENGSYCVLDFVKDSIYFNDFDLFRVRFSDNMSDILMSWYIDSNGNEIYFNRVDSTYIAGTPVYINLAARDIPLDIYDGKKYIPFQTLNDLFISPYEINYLFNSKDLFKLAVDGTIDPSLEEKYYSITPTERSEALANYTVNELCLVLDLYYGLQDRHGISGGFEQYLERIGLLDDLLSNDPLVADIALASLFAGYLADLHSDVLMPSPYTGDMYFDRTNVKYGSSLIHYWDHLDMFNETRQNAMPNGAPGYQEIGNTAYITFDSFTLSFDRFSDYTQEAAEIDDTLGLIIYAHSMIKRENSPIENVVLDLSCNSGGYVDSGVYLVAWMLGYCELNINNPVTNSFSTMTYTVDVNLDGEFNKEDTISDKNLYCLVSPVSFSCSNNVVSSLKGSGMVTLIGNTSGGGACAVQLMTAADGSVYAFSTSYRECTLINGSYYDIDQGISPHFFLSKPESYYDRESLTDYINSLK